MHINYNSPEVYNHTGDDPEENQGRSVNSDANNQRFSQWIVLAIGTLFIITITLKYYEII